MNPSFSRTWAEIDLDKIAHNVKEFRRIVDSKAQIMAVVKADGYGHGAVEVGKIALLSGASRLAVATIDEAIALRDSGIDCPIFVLNYVDTRRIKDIVDYNIIQTIYTYEFAKAISDYGIMNDKSVKVHIKVDTGMTRVGIMHGRDAVRSILEISKLKNIEVEGIFTHFAKADETDKSYTEMQFERFMNVCEELRENGLDIPIKHVANSAAIIDCPHMHLDLVRPGISIYGLYPSSEIKKERIELKEGMTLKTKIIRVQKIPEGTCISYGGICRTGRESRIATLPIGYADGFTRALTNKGTALVKGKEVPIVGKICMDQCMIDITDINEEIKVGEEVVLFGKQGNSEIKIDQVAHKLGTINYEIVCMLGKRIPRVYFKEGKLI